MNLRSNKAGLMLVITASILVLIIISVFALAGNSNDDVVDTAIGVAQSQKQYIKGEKGEVVLTINGVDIHSSEYLEKKAVIEAIRDTEINKDDVIKNLALKISYYTEAEIRGIFATDDEVNELLQEERSLYNKTATADRKYMDAYIDELGLTQDEYWTQFKFVETHYSIIAGKVNNAIIEEAENKTIDFSSHNEKIKYAKDIMEKKAVDMNYVILDNKTVR